MKTFEGKLVSKSIKVGIVAARFNEFITSKLLSGALDGLLRHEVREDDVHVAWVPGAFEIPLVAAKMAKSGRYDAVICLGAVIRGSTSHYDYVCNEVSKGIAAVSLESGVPVLFGVLTTENIEQAIERAGTKAGNKGYDCAVSAIEMVNLLTSWTRSNTQTHYDHHSSKRGRGGSGGKDPGPSAAGGHRRRAGLPQLPAHAYLPGADH